MSGHGLGLQLVLLAIGLAGCAGLLLIRGRRAAPTSSAQSRPSAESSSAGVARVATALALLVLLVGGLASWQSWSHTRSRILSLEQLEAELPSRLVQSPDESAPAYVSSDQCQSCHPGRFASWHRTYHRTMTQKAVPGAILGRFEGQVLEARGRRYVLERRGDEYWVEMADPDWERDLLDRGKRPERFAHPPRRWKRIVLTTGSHHMQTYWVASERDGRLFNFPWLWLIEDERWIPREDGFIRPPEGARTFDVWHGACIECHAVAGEKTQGPAGEWAPEAAELGIACEACHGPAEDHVRANANPLRRYRYRLSGEPDPTIVNPERLDARSSSQVCGHCHGMNIIKGDALDQGKRFRPGDEISETGIVMRTSEKARLEARARTSETERPDDRDWRNMQRFFRRMLAQDESYLVDRFWPDGMIRVSGREHNGMVESACFDGGQLSCLSCHSMHDAEPDDQLAEGRAGDGACLQCHGDYAEDIESHTHHPVESTGSRCNNCHMPHTVYGLLKSIRSHWIDRPSVEVELATGRPNACSLCHLDRPLGWTADRLTSWYGQPRPALSEDEEEVAEGVRWLLVGNAHQRALVAWHLGWPDARAAWRADDGWERFFLGHLLEDPYSAVRYIALRSLGEAEGLDDPSTATQDDFLAPPPRRAAMRSRVMAAWKPTTRDAALLLTPEGAVDQAAFDRLARMRDDVEMDLRE